MCHKLQTSDKTISVGSLNSKTLSAKRSLEIKVTIKSIDLLIWGHNAGGCSDKDWNKSSDVNIFVNWVMSPAKMKLLLFIVSIFVFTCSAITSTSVENQLQQEMKQLKTETQRQIDELKSACTVPKLGYLFLLCFLWYICVRFHSRNILSYSTFCIPKIYKVGQLGKVC